MTTRITPVVVALGTLAVLAWLVDAETTRRASPARPVAAPGVSGPGPELEAIERLLEDGRPGEAAALLAGAGEPGRTTDARLGVEILRSRLDVLEATMTRDPDARGLRRLAGRRRLDAVWQRVVSERRLGAPAGEGVPDDVATSVASTLIEIDLWFDGPDRARERIERLSSACRGTRMEAGFARAASDLDRRGSAFPGVLEGLVPVVTGRPEAGRAPADAARWALPHCAVVVQFWASWDPASVRELEEIDALVGRSAGPPAAVGVAVDEDERARAVEATVARLTARWPQFRARGGWLSPVVRRLELGRRGLPARFLVGADGKVVRVGADRFFLSLWLRRTDPTSR